jgi:hypothetical protein
MRQLLRSPGDRAPSGNWCLLSGYPRTLSRNAIRLQGWSTTFTQPSALSRNIVHGQGDVEVTDIPAPRIEQPTDLV